MLTLHCRFCLALLVSLLTACAADPPVSAGAGQPKVRFDPAPMPFVQYGRRASTVGSLAIPVPPKMPPGTGAVPVSNSPFRGSFATGFKESF